MHPDVPQGLLDLHRQAEQLAQQARALTPAAGTAGVDSTSCARVVIGRDGFPVDIHIADRWQRLCDAENLAAAVLEAHRDALQKTPEPQDEAPPTAPSGQVVDLAELAERAITALQQAQRTATRPPTVHTGADDARHVTIEFGAGGLTGCVIDARWAADRDGTTITAALAAALSRASAPVPEFDALLGDALATLSALTKEPR